MKRGIQATLALAWAVARASAAMADDGAVVAVGGSVSPMAAHPSISLQSEFVHIDFRQSPAEVDCVFFLKNNGPATTVTIGFPNESSGADVSEPVPFKHFASYVDGDTAGVTLLPDAGNAHSEDKVLWYVKTVPFAAGQTRCIRNVYSGTEGGTSIGDSAFEYILWSGSTWAGAIGTADIVVTWDPKICPIDSVSAAPPGWDYSGNELRWHFHEIDPHRGEDASRIRLGWWRMK